MLNHALSTPDSLKAPAPRDPATSPGKRPQEDMPAGGSLAKALRCNLSDEELIKREDKGTFSGRYVSGALATAEPMVAYLLH